MNKEHLQAIYRDCEFNVIPIRPETKKPLESWLRWQADRVDVDTLVRWSRGRFVFVDDDGERLNWQHRGPINYAVLTGRKPWSQIPGIVILDSDDEAAQELVDRHCPPTPLITRTPSGGIHNIYRMPDIDVRNRQKTRSGGKDFNLDVRGNGGYALTPGSLKPDGGEYIASGFWKPEIVATLPVYDPAWIPIDERPTTHQPPQLAPEDAGEARRLLASEPAEMLSTLARTWLQRQRGATAGRGADKYVFAIAVRLLHGFGLDDETAVELLAEWGTRDDQQDEAGRYFPWRCSEIENKISYARSVAYESPGDEYVAELKSFIAWQQEQQANEIVAAY